MTCPTCESQTPTIKATIFHGHILEGCDNCLNTLVKGTELAAQNHRTHDQRKFAADTVQPFQEDFVKLYGPERAREYGWDEESIRKFG